MQYVHVNPRVLGYLGRALSHELSAVQQYLTQSKLVEAWGQLEAAGRLRDEAAEEMGHAERIVERMIALGAAPSASQLRPAQFGATLGECLNKNHRVEMDAIALYEDAVRYCRRIQDRDNGAFFEVLWNEEIAHGREMAQWAAALDTANAGGRRAFF